MEDYWLGKNEVGNAAFIARKNELAGRKASHIKKRRAAVVGQWLVLTLIFGVIVRV